MKLEQQVCSLDLAKRLKELGVEQNGFCQYKKFSDRPDGSEHLVLDDGCRMGKDENCISAFTVAELGEMLPELMCSIYYINNQGKKVWRCMPDEGFEEVPEEIYNIKSDTEADARAKMLIYLLENNLTPPTKP